MKPLPPISLEFFPPKTPEGFLKHEKTRQELYILQPEYCSVTYGAGGSTQTGSFATLQAILNEGVTAAAHFSCIGATKESVKANLHTLQKMGVKRIVALRGDLPSGYGLGGEFQYAGDLVSFIRQTFGDAFYITVAAYPETHPQARTPSADLNAFASKMKAGANDAITQYFFNMDAFLRFRDDAQKLGIHAPIIPGIMPITNSTQLLRFSDNCGAEVPRWLRLRLESFGDDHASIKAFGLEVMMRLCERLIEHGVPALHFYTMNQSDAVLKICQQIQMLTA